MNNRVCSVSKAIWWKFTLISNFTSQGNTGRTGLVYIIIYRDLVMISRQPGR